MFDNEDSIYYMDQAEEQETIYREQSPIYEADEDELQGLYNSSSKTDVNEMKKHNITIPINEIVNNSNQTRRRSRDKMLHKWDFNQHKKYINFYLKIQLNKLYLNLSWNEWKINNIYPQAAQFLAITEIQVKNHDQGMKENYSDIQVIYLNPNLEASIKKQKSNGKFRLSQKTQTEKSKHMILAQQSLRRQKIFQLLMNKLLNNHL